MSGKETKACTDVKQTVVLPRKDLKFKALGFAITPSELKDWGAYVKALSGRNIPVTAVQTNLTFDAQASHPKCLFSFGGMLTAAEYAQVQERAKGDDVKVIIEPIVRALALPAPATQPAAPPVMASTVENTPAMPSTAAREAPAAAAAPVVTGFGAAPAAQPDEPAKRTRRTRAQMEAAAAATAAAATAANAQAVSAPAAAVQAAHATAADPHAHLPPEIKAAVQAVGVESPAGRAILSQYPKPAAAQNTSPVVPTEMSAPAAAPVVTGFGGAPAVAATATAAAASVGQSLRDKLAAKLASAQKAA